jgi:hypothetical protein
MSAAVEHERFILSATIKRDYDYIASCDIGKCPLLFVASGGNS